MKKKLHQTAVKLRNNECRGTNEIYLLLTDLLQKKAGCKATDATCGWARAVMNTSFSHFSISGTNRRLQLLPNKRLRCLHSACLRKCREIGALVARDTSANHQLYILTDLQLLKNCGLKLPSFVRSCRGNKFSQSSSPLPLCLVSI